MTGCDYLTWYRGEDRRCNRVTGARRWYDSNGTLHTGCGSHYPALVRRFPEADAPEPDWLHEAKAEQDRTEVTLANVRGSATFTDAGWTEAELRASWGDR